MHGAQVSPHLLQFAFTPRFPLTPLTTADLLLPAHAFDLHETHA